MSKDHLSTYLNDHLMGAVAAIEVVDQFADEAPDLRAFLNQLKADIEADRAEVVNLMDTLGMPQSRIRKASGWLAEQFAEMKFAMEDENLRRLERFEALALGIQGKLSLWRALDAASSLDSRLCSLDYGRLVRRAMDQLERVEALRIKAAKSALTTTAA
jgi:hypothetical protein